MNEPEISPADPNRTDGVDAAIIDLAQVQRHAVELLAQLDRPPSNLRIQAREILVEINWAEPTVIGEVRSIEVHREQREQQRTQPVADTDDGGAKEFLTSPGVGVFYHAREPGAEPFVSVGAVVRPGQQIGIIEAMKLMIPVEADRAGRIAAVVKGNGEPVEYGEPLFELAAAEIAEAA
ncbi:MAG TPA: biotin/lipoyl-containing protein [Actinophytocola sp.]|uniref:acetyl-CoA carboxylase biotin carboxyl carrier protein n=1 Tax=Actinophytocola sp. TaxID=1872138 RepID=UPI002DDD0BFC|nr:biotin/lipoyl-containing protein [Actinophytocola sp.]HEV2780502.1 biotin/lipoyl-containing protein [Actinophytocola sp.]